jgi:hypothetical protein
MNKNFIILGMFRSGTTMLARRLSVHPNIHCASDPFFQFYKALRNAAYDHAWSSYNYSDEPVCDLFSSMNPELDIFIERNLDIYSLNIGAKDLSHLKERIIEYTMRDSPKIAENINDINAKNYGECATQLFQITEKSYYNKSITAYGFKLTFAESLAMSSIRGRTEIPVIFLFRNPCDIQLSQTASSLIESNKYPILYVIRKWRDSVRVYFDFKEKHPLFLLRLEDFIKNPEKKLSQIAEFLNVPVDLDLMDPKLMKNDNNVKWEINTSFTKQISITKKDLYSKCKDELEFIKIACCPELYLLGYINYKEFNDLCEKSLYLLIKLAKVIKDDDIYDWFSKTNSCNLYRLNERQLSREINRIKYAKTIIDSGSLHDEKAASRFGMEYMKNNLLSTPFMKDENKL